MTLPKDVSYPYSVTIKKGNEINGQLYVPEMGEDSNENVWTEYEIISEEDDEIVLEIGSEQYNGYDDINMHIVDDVISNFALRVVYPQAPFDALGVAIKAGVTELIYPNDVIVLQGDGFAESQMLYTNLGYEQKYVFFTPLNEQTTIENCTLKCQPSVNKNYKQQYSWPSSGMFLTSFMLEGNAPGQSVQITTPKGSFIINVTE